MDRTVRIAVIGCLALPVCGALGDDVAISFDGISGNYGHGVSVSLGGGLTFADGTTSKSVWSGQISHTIDGTEFKTFCTELTQWAHSGTYDVIEVGDAPASRPMGGAAADAIYRLFNATNGAADIDSNAKGAAFQAVIWEIAYDFASGLDLSSGLVQITGVSQTWFDAFAAMALDPQGDTSANVIAYTNDQWQDQLGVRMVPMPGAAAMGGLGLLAIGSRRRRGS